MNASVVWFEIRWLVRYWGVCGWGEVRCRKVLILGGSSAWGCELRWGGMWLRMLVEDFVKTRIGKRDRAEKVRSLFYVGINSREG